jgi:proline iminopeptidase
MGLRAGLCTIVRLANSRPKEGDFMRRSMAMIASASLLLVGSCRVADAPKEKGSTASYFDNSKHPDAWSGGARKITISTTKGPHQVWIKRVGNNPKLKLLLLTGGPGFAHSYLEVMDSYLPAEGVEYYHYDQLETGESDRPDDPDFGPCPLCRRGRPGSPRDRRNEGQFLRARPQLGGMLAMEYALAHQDQLKCLVISNMMASIPAYNAYAKKVLEPRWTRPFSSAFSPWKPRQDASSRLHGASGANWYEQHILRRRRPNGRSRCPATFQG